MKRIAFYFLILAFSFGAQANLQKKVREQIRVEAQLLVNGKVVSSPTVIALAGEKASIAVGQGGATEQMRMGVVANPADPRMDEIVLDMDLRFKHGEKQIRSTPQVYVKSGVAAVMTLEESTASEKIQLKVTAKPVLR